MLRITALIACTCLALAAAEPASSDGQGGGLRQRLLQKFDADHDGKLSDSERAAAKTALHDRLAEAKARFDTDHDGKLSDSERAAARAALAARLKEKHPKLFARIDSDGDGQLSQAELQAAKAKLQELRQHHRDGAAQ